MKRYLITGDKIELLIQIYNRLALIEVKGDSVEHLFASRSELKRLVESLPEIVDKKEDEIKEE